MNLFKNQQFLIAILLLLYYLTCNFFFRVYSMMKHVVKFSVTTIQVLVAVRHLDI